MRKIPRSRDLALMIVAGWAGYVLAYLALWEAHPEWQTVLNRISWTTADFIAIAATGLALYTYHLFERGLQSNVAEQIIEWASKKENQPKLDQLLRNILACEATGQALDIAINYARQKLIKTFEGKAGKEIAEFRRSFKGTVPESIQKLFDNKWVDHAVKAISIVDGVLKTLRNEQQGRPPDEPPDQSVE